MTSKVSLRESTPNYRPPPQRRLDNKPEFQTVIHIIRKIITDFDSEFQPDEQPFLWSDIQITQAGRVPPFMTLIYMYSGIT